jgi:hypothetical protein
MGGVLELGTAEQVSTGECAYISFSPVLFSFRYRYLPSNIMCVSVTQVDFTSTMLGTHSLSIQSILLSLRNLSLFFSSLAKEN